MIGVVGISDTSMLAMLVPSSRARFSRPVTALTTISESLMAEALRAKSTLVLLPARMVTTEVCWVNPMKFTRTTRVPTETFGNK